MALAGHEGETAHLREGTVLEGKYQVEQVLGTGGLGIVVSARHLQLGQRVALKFLRGSVLDDRAIVERFSREARILARLRSEHVARVLDVGTIDGAPYMVLEYLEGEDLAEVLRRGAVPPRAAIDLLLQACDAVAEAHAAGIVHRDLKPSNLFLTRRSDGSPLVKVLDFGVAKTIDQDLSDPSVTDTGVAVGSPRYMSPEQLLSSRDVDRRADVWSLGVILYELLSARVPYEAESVGQVCAAILAKPPPPLVPPPGVALAAGLEAVVRRCLRRDVEARFPSVADLAEALLPFASAELTGTVRRIRRLEPAGPGDHTQPLKVPGPSDSTPIVTARPDSALHDLPTQIGTIGMVQPADPPPVARRRWFVLGGLALGGVVSAVLLTRLGEQTRSELVREVRPAPSRAVPAASGRVKIEVRARPAGARIFLDGELLGGPVVDLERAIDAATHRLRVEAPGHATEDRVLTLERDLRLDLALAALEDPRQAPPGRASPDRAEPDRAERSPMRAERTRGVKRAPRPGRPVAEPPLEAPAPRATLDTSDPWK